MKEIFSRKEILEFNMSWAEVAKQMFINESTVGAIEKRALAKLRTEFERRNIKYRDLV